MFSPPYTKRLATALAGAAIASALAVSGASADPHAIDAASREANPPQVVAPPPSSIAASAAEQYQDLRLPDRRMPPQHYATALDQQPVADEPSEPSGFDFVSAAIGAIAAGAVALVLMAAMGLRRPPRGRPASA
jgi:hypothetical protein